MQPYFLPYMGYFQLMNSVDKFVVYDDVQFTKRGWINRNSLITKRGDWKFSVACSSAPEDTIISEITIAPEYDRRRFVSRIKNEFSNHEHFNKDGLNLANLVINYEESNLFKYIFNSIDEISRYLEISTDKLVISSEIGDFRKFRGRDKVIEICKEINADTYVNPVSGQHLYQREFFNDHSIQLNFFQPSINHFENSDTSASVLQNLLTEEKSSSIVKSQQGQII